MACALLVIIGRLTNLDNFSLTVWGDRDLWRGLACLSTDVLPSRGPETNSGYRPLGGFFYMMLAALLSVWSSVKVANLAVTGLYLISILLVAGFLWREVSLRTGAIAALALTGAGLVKSTLGVWNPGFIIVFASAVVVFSHVFVKTGRSRYLGLAVLFSMLGSQIHMQITVLVATLPLIMMVYRIRPRWSHLFAVSGSVVIAYGPSLISAGASLLGSGDNAGSGELWTNLEQYIRTDPALLLERLRVVGGNFFAAAGGSAMALKNALLGRYEFVYWLLWVPDALATVAAAWAVFVFWPRRGEDVVNAPRGVGVYSVFVVVYFVVFAFADVNFRHFVAIVPAVAALVALGVERYLDYLKRSNPVITSAVGAIIVITALSGRSLISGGVDFGASGFNPSSFLAQDEIARHVKARYFADYETFESRSSLFVLDGDRVRFLPPNIGNRMATAFSLAAVNNTVVQPAARKCLLILAKPGGQSIDIEDLIGAVKRQLQSINAIVDHKGSSVSSQFLYVTYKTVDGSCLKSFPNPYIETRFETRFLAPLAFAFPTTTIAFEEMQRRVVFVIPSPTTPFPWGVEMAPADVGFRLIVHGRRLRGHTGLAQLKLKDLSVQFDGGTVSRRITFGENAIGDMSAGILAPWASEPFNLHDGVYRVRLSAAASPGGQIKMVLGTVEVIADKIRVVRGK
tara:strand:- start:913 stop:2964 length:2052 start_codon:yes stop_codon:yes gene_type:complete